MTAFLENRGFRIRKIFPRRDNAAIADLIEESFREFLDPDGKAFIETLRAEAGKGVFSQLWFDSFRTETEGFVCLNAENRIIGLIHLIPIQPPEGRGYLIVNVCVAESYRRQGIAKELLRSAISYARNFAASALYLQLRSGNPAVYQLYASNGFQSVTVRTDWIKEKTDAVDIARSARLRTSCAVPRDCERGEFLRAAALAYPPEFRWNLSWDNRLFEFSRTLRWLKRLLGGGNEFLTVRNDTGRILGWIAFQTTGTYANRVWVVPAAFSAVDGRGELIAAALQRFRSGKPLLINCAASENRGILAEFGFRANHDLIWMRLDLIPDDSSDVLTRLSP